MATNEQRAQIGRINRLLAKDGRVLQKVREDSRYFAEQGPFRILDDRSGVLTYGIDDLDEIEAELKGRCIRVFEDRRSVRAFGERIAVLPRER